MRTQGGCDQITLMKKVSKTIGLVAHDNRKKDLIEWVAWNSAILMHHRLVCTARRASSSRRR